ncbi:type I polyketide synthase [Streptomyces sp. NPDC001985]|uniref:type I polyketide synthase n=1 Tax=Streptomyces sp. NPDC001985 TaxID=3154406 RepID=UPI003317E25F
MSSTSAGDAADDSIAVVGMACRLPGAPGPGAFWEMLAAGRDAVRPAPPDRAAGLGGLGAAGGPGGVPHGGFLDDVAGFDAAFFGIAPREAAAMDPQQRLLLELAWEALEDAWIVPGTLRSSDTGVFIGAMADDWAQLTHLRGPAAMTPHTLQGTQRGVLANRISHALDLRGPSLTVDTGQSSALVGVHLACEALRRGEAGTALAGGVNLLLAPGTWHATARFGGLSPAGRCHTFDTRADGYARGEGGALVVLKPLGRALADGDRVHCVILGGAMGSDGGTEALTVPGRATQEEVLRRACLRAGVAPSRVQYVELHGTGTRVGDPVEAAALGAVFGSPGAGRDRALRVGSAKTNVGHLEGAAGLVGLLKTALCLRHRQLVPSLNFTAAPPGIPLERLGLRVQTEYGDWPLPEERLVAGVSSFGMGGTNCHLLLAEPPERPGEQTDERTDGPAPAAVPWPLSARSEPALRAQARALRRHLGRHPGAASADIGHTLATARSHHEHRAVVVGEGATAPLDALAALAEGRSHHRLVRGRSGSPPPELAVLFAGQGGARPGAGHGLYTAFPEFARAVDELCGHFDAVLEQPLRALMFAPAGDTGAAELLRRTDYAQPALFTLETALLRLLGSWGVVPGVLAGHSLGELTAAHAAGVLSTADATALVAARGRLMHWAGGDGAMIAVEAAEEEVRGMPGGLPGTVDIAAVNSPASVVVSGDAAAVERIAGHWAERGRRTRRLRTRHAFHSPHMDPLLAEFRRIAGRLAYRPPTLPVVSHVTGRLATSDELCSPEYWTAHLRATVRFADGVRTLLARGTGAFLELGPDATLTTLAAGSLPPADDEGPPPPVLTAALRPGRDEPLSVLAAAGALHTAGLPVEWGAVIGAGRRRVELPPYAFQRERYRLPPGAPGTTDAEPENGPAPETSAGPRQPYTAVRAADPPPPAAPRALPGATGRERLRAAVRLVRDEAAAVLGHPGPAAIDPDRPFRDAGFDSVTGVELCGRLRAATGAALAVTAVFDRPTPAELARHLLTLLPAAPASPEPDTASAALGALEALRAAVATGARQDPGTARRLAGGLRELLAALPADTGDATGTGGGAPDPTDLTEKIGTASDDEIFALIDRECGDASPERS